MKYFKKLSTLLIILMVISIISGAFAINSATDNSININPTKNMDKNSSRTKTLYVSTNGTDLNDGLTPGKAKRNIQNAINTAKSGDTIQVAKGTYRENLKINKNITLKGNNQKDTIIHGQEKASCISVENSCFTTIKEFTITNGKSIFGGGINNLGDLNVVNSKINNNSAEYGGGLFNDLQGNLTIKNSTITSNLAKKGGGLFNQGIMNYNSTLIENNTPDNIAITKILYVATTGDDNNDGLSPDTPKKTIQDAIDLTNPGDTVQLAQGTYKETLAISENIILKGKNQKDTIIDGQHYGRSISGEKGFKAKIQEITLQNGGIYNKPGCTLTLVNSTITGTTNPEYRGGIENYGTLTLINSTVKNFVAQGDGRNSYGGGINNGGVLTIHNSTIANNTAKMEGGGICNDGGTLDIRNSVIANNTGKLDGGGIASRYASSTVIIDSIITGNIGGNGGGIDGDADIRNSVIANNTAVDCGGGINSAELTLTNSMISNNTAHANGGGICNYGWTLVIKNSIITKNIAQIEEGHYGQGGGIYTGHEGFSIDDRRCVKSNRPDNIFEG
jgi:hypothetical protein